MRKERGADDTCASVSPPSAHFTPARRTAEKAAEEHDRAGGGGGGKNERTSRWMSIRFEIASDASDTAWLWSVIKRFDWSTASRSSFWSLSARLVVSSNWSESIGSGSEQLDE